MGLAGFTLNASSSGFSIRCIHASTISHFMLGPRVPSVETFINSALAIITFRLDVHSSRFKVSRLPRLAAVLFQLCARIIELAASSRILFPPALSLSENRKSWVWRTRI